MFFYFFFFSSRRRHTRSLCDWSSDVCSSDLLRSGTVSAIHAEANPTDTVPDLNAGDLLRRHYRCIEHVYGAVRTVREPKFLLVRSQSDSMTRACVTFDGTLGVAINLHPA